MLKNERMVGKRKSAFKNKYFRLMQTTVRNINLNNEREDIAINIYIFLQSQETY